MSTTVEDDVLGVLRQARIVPVVVLDDSALAAALARTLRHCGLPAIEITLRTTGALAALEATSAVPGVVAGAGTVTSTDQVDDAVAAGARFLVSPGVSEEVVARARHHGVPVIPGTATATDLMTASRLGLEVVKFFPAEPLGGLSLLSALAQPFPGIRFVPTGGVGPDNLGGYLAHPAVLAVGGTWMVPRSALSAGSLDEVRRLSEEARAMADRVTA
jgi:2-dehydro-3-deoxyphosphogluconate aldolase/(4S)-4-hydroxy-2-oxoglutarate aldolase